ncbi:MAG: hypothetical protein CFH37_00634 [Alphaproteobacteria bacterium MarineAlpha9_Bin7]|nr:MAG: hypothetical protein CFH37_00634 [Alphaproteobacteria bacterium MarineAlpha9_Bin7]
MNVVKHSHVDSPYTRLPVMQGTTRPHNQLQFALWLKPVVLQVTD